MNALFAAALDFQTFCHEHGWQMCIIGGLAVQRWGEPRQTRDVDLTLLTGIGGEERFVDPLLARYRARVPDARVLAIERRVLLIETAEGIPVDVSLGGLPYEARVIARASPFAVAVESAIVTCSAEDLVVLKAFADRPQDWLDIEGVVVRQGHRLDRDGVLAELRPLLELKEDWDPERKLLAVYTKHAVAV